MIESGQHIGLAICTGCGIGEALDTGRVLGSALEMFPEIKCMQHGSLCSEEGIDALLGLSRDDQITHLAVAGCSPRVKTERFHLGAVEVERINLREQLVWVMEPGVEDTLLCAEDQVKMGLSKLSGRTSQEPYHPESISRAILVLGGGIAGMTAALAGADAGYQVYLVEKENSLGGHMRKIIAPDPCVGKGTADPFPELQTLVKKVGAHPEITVYTSTVIGAISGEPGNFTVTLNCGLTRSVTAGAVVLATGWEPYEPQKLKHLGYGKKGVSTLEEFEEQLSSGSVPGSVLFIMCAGSRDESHLSYCSSYCCAAALKQVLHVREKNPEAVVYVIYRDIRTPGFQEELYRQVQEDNLVFMTKGRVQGITQSGNTLRTEIRETLLGEEVVIQSESIVLVTGMVPGNPEALELDYRQGKGLPELACGFPDSHFICFPYETRRTGIYAAGTARAPMDMISCLDDATGAMMKAIQCIEATGQGRSVHPRSGETAYPELYMERCTDCMRCTEECPFGSYDQNEKGTPLPNPARCRRCGICLGSCPERVIGFPDFSINLVSSMIKSVHIPDEFEEKPRVLVFLCENDAYPALDAAGLARIRLNPFIRVIPVRCLGSINKVWISDTLSHGFDGILQIGCKPGDDYQCHFIRGSQLTEERTANLKETLETMMLEPERIKTCFVEITDINKITGIINAYVEALVSLGPNPFKSM